ncbi:MAG: hypothetical protein AABY22_14305 [Nanoarchaeota archaeon]
MIQKGYSITKLIVTEWGEHCGIAPMTDGSFEFYNKRNILLGKIVYRKSWKCYVWQQEKDIDMSKSCIYEIFNLLEKEIKE